MVLSLDTFNNAEWRCRVEVSYKTIKSKPNDFKVCNHCNAINWHENKKCVNEECQSPKFFGNEQNVVSVVIGAEYSYCKQIKHFTEYATDVQRLEV